MNMSRTLFILKKHAGRSSYGPASKVLFALVLSALVVGQSWGESASDVNHDSLVEHVANHGPVRVTTRVDRTSAQIADKITLTLSVLAPTGVHITFPETGDSLGQFDVLDVHETLDIPVVDGRLSTRTYELESLVAGKQVIPSIGIPFADKSTATPTLRVAQSNPIEITINSLLEGQTDPTQFRDIKGIVQIERPETPRVGLLAAAAGGILLAGAGFAFVLTRRKSRELNPENWALNEIDYLESLCEAGEIDAEQFYTEITDIVRCYVERQFHIAALRLTTAEFFDQIQTGRDLNDEHVALLCDFLADADMVKFAGLTLGPADAANATVTARKFIHESAAAGSIDRLSREAA